MLSNIQHRVSSVKIECKMIDENNNKLKRENQELQNKISCFLINQC